ncbi:MaoC/PaaZ C-terminal domain-containing protein [Phenylobacterium sp.]|uniref:MaoC family dehydratase n=1 Tax=Phenylobacterium sp. TaxID=1871053 RepID=UPI0035B0D8A1
MPLDYEMLMSLPPREVRQSHSARDTILYALGVGAADDLDANPASLKFLYEEGLQALPTMAAVAAYPGFWLKEPQYGLDWRRILHGEQSITWLRPMPAGGDLSGVITIDAIVDKGAEKGAVLHSSRRIYAEDGDHIATVRQASVLRGDGGFGGGDPPPSDPRPKPPSRPADYVHDQTTVRSQALLYRLSGDLNPLHADPTVAKAAGFERPILHGLATYGIVGRAVLHGLCGGDPAALKRYDVRFSSPVYPGETLRSEIWRVGAGAAVLTTTAVERGVRVLSDGYVEIAND